ncbi:hypothetical protein PROFUN_14685, partial [Planoprotostelium fungivorum]
VWYKEEHEGWYRGMNQKTLFSGWFPSNYVKPTGTTIRLPKIIDDDEIETHVEDDEDEAKRMSVDTSRRSSRIKELQKRLRENSQSSSVFQESNDE